MSSQLGSPVTRPNRSNSGATQRKMLHWELDELTEYWATRCVLPLHSPSPQPQYDGEGFEMSEPVWLRHTLRTSFPDYCKGPSRKDPRHLTLFGTPSNIIACLREERVLEGLALIVAWGRMFRNPGAIYRTSLPRIELALRNSTDSIVKDGSIRTAWADLTEQLKWSPVITSKCLHFVARALDYEQNPPVPIDNSVVLRKVWPKFKHSIARVREPGDPDLCRSWRRGTDSWGAYNRYMTAVVCWARERSWTTTQFENTMFADYRSK